MAGISNSMVLLAAVLLLLLLPATSPLPVAVDDEEATTVAPAGDREMQADEAVPEDDEEMRGRMAYLILSLWDEDLQGLEGLDARAYQDDDGDEDDQRRATRRKRDLVFRPLWVSRERSARTNRRRQRYWDELRRSQRFGRDVDATAAAAAVRARRSATVEDDAEMLLSPNADVAASRVRRQWAFRPLFAARQAEDLRFRVRRDVQDEDREDGSGRASRVRRQWANRPLFSTRQRAARRRLNRARGRREVAPSRQRREWVDVPLFAVKQIEASRVREENEVTHPHHPGAASLTEAEREREYRDYVRKYENYYGRDLGNEYRPYRDYYRFNG